MVHSIRTFSGINAVTGQDESSSGMSAGAAVLPRAVRRALDVMQAGIERDIGLAELAMPPACSARALQLSSRPSWPRARTKRCATSRIHSAQRQLLLGKPGTK